MGPVQPRGNRPIQTISIHPSRVGWDSVPRGFGASRKNFNPPIPCGMGQGQVHVPSGNHDISIHPSRVGWDT